MSKELGNKKESGLARGFDILELTEDVSKI
jgi:hypothetical protein